MWRRQCPRRGRKHSVLLMFRVLSRLSNSRGWSSKIWKLLRTRQEVEKTKLVWKFGTCAFNLIYPKSFSYFPCIPSRTSHFPNASSCGPPSLPLSFFFSSAPQTTSPSSLLFSCFSFSSLLSLFPYIIPARWKPRPEELYILCSSQ